MLCILYCLFMLFFLMIRRPPSFTLTYTLFPFTSLFRSVHADLPGADGRSLHGLRAAVGPDVVLGREGDHLAVRRDPGHRQRPDRVDHGRLPARRRDAQPLLRPARDRSAAGAAAAGGAAPGRRSEEHTSELQSLMRISYAVFCLK